MKNINFEEISAKIMPYINKFTQNRWVKSISSGFMYVIPFSLVSAIFSIIATPPVTGEIVEAGGWYGNLMSGWYNFAQANHSLLTIPSNLTIGLISVISLFGISYKLATELELKDKMTSSLTAFIMFLIVASPMTSAVLSSVLSGEGDLESLLSSTTNVLDTTNLGSQGLFVAMIVAVLSVEITNFCLKKNITLRFKGNVSEVVVAPFKALIPVLMNLIVFFGLSILVDKFLGTTLPNLIMGAILPAVDNVNSFWGFVFISTFGTVLWFFGVHGSAITSMLYIPIVFQVTAQNAELVAAGASPEWHPIFISGAASAMIGLNLAMLLVGKSDQMKTVSKLAIVPSLFNIHEPVIFGTPIIFNVALIIPNIVVPIVQMAAMYFLGVSGFLVGNYNMIMVNLPLGLNQFFGTNSLSTAVIGVVIQLLGTILWIPFVKLYDKQLLLQEGEIVTEELSTGKTDKAAQEEEALSSTSESLEVKGHE